MKERGIAFLAGLWRLLAAIWTLVIVSALAGALGNIIYTLATKRWFTKHEGWLQVVDNADDLAMAG